MKIQFDRKLMDDPRLLDFARDIDCTRWLVVGYLFELYGYWIDNCLSTNLTDRASLVTRYALAARQNGAELGERIVESLLKAGFVEIDAEGMVSLPDFEQLFGPQLVNRRKTVERMRKIRSKRYGVT